MTVVVGRGRAPSVRGRSFSHPRRLGDACSRDPTCVECHEFAVLEAQGRPLTPKLLNLRTNVLLEVSILLPKVRSGTQGGDSTGSLGDEAMKLNTEGDLFLSGALARIKGRDKVGITSNVFNDMINNFNGAVYWFKGIQGGDSEGGGARLMKLDTNGDLEVKGKVKASNSVKEYDSGWFNITPLQTVDVIHDLGVLPKHVTVWCANRGSGDPTSPSIAGPFFVKSSATEDRGAYIAKVTTTRLQVRAGSYLGINEAHNNWLTSGRYRVVVWA